MRNLRLRALAFLIAIATLIAAVGLRAQDSTVVATLRGAGFDLLQQIWPREMDAPAPVRIIDIDEASLAALGQWPWPRNLLAAMTNELLELGAAVVAFDIVFPEPDRTSPRQILKSESLGVAAQNPAVTEALMLLPDHDALFATAIQGKPVVMALAASGKDNATTAVVKAGFAQTGAPASTAPPLLQGITSNIEVLNGAATGIGGINIDLAREQGVARQIPMLYRTEDRFLPALVPEALRVAQGASTFLVHAADELENAIETVATGDIEFPVSENGFFHIHYRKNDPAMYVSAARVIAGRERDELRTLIEGHVVFVGTSAVGLLDIRTSALGESVPGVSVHAQAAEQILTGAFLTRPEWAVGAEFAGVILGGLLLAMLGSLIKPWKTMLVFMALSAATLVLVAWGFRSVGLLLDATFPLLALALTFLSVVAMRLLVTDRESRKLRGAFGQYVAPSVLAEIESNPNALKLGGEMRDVSVMFVDIENFTPLGERLPPEILVKVINRLLDTCSKEILLQKGTIDKYIGDAVMAFWNAPVLLPEHQLYAARAALGIRSAVARLNDDAEISGLLTQYSCPRLAVRVGIASGPACVGNMGSENRFDYSVLGETVNVASRAEGACKNIGHDIVVAGDLRPETAKLATFPAGHVPMKGKSKPQPLEAIVGPEEQAKSELFTALKTALAETTAQLLRHRKGKRPLVLQSLLDELVSQHPEFKKYIECLPERLVDFAPPEDSTKKARAV